MLSFAYPRLLLLLLLVPAVAGLYILARRSRRRKLRKFASAENLPGLMPDVSPYKPALKLTLSLLALTCMIIALARPWGGVTDQKSDKYGMEIALAVDASNSMSASVTDSPDDASRMVTAKVMLERLIDNFTSDKVGLVVFAGEAYQLIPASTDYTSAKSFLNTITPDEIPVQGTDIASAVDVARQTFTDSKDLGRAIILLTDAEELDDEQAAIEAMRGAAADGIQVDVIGVGSPDTPATIPDMNGAMTDSNGQIVRTSFNERLARELAKVGGGVYVNASSPDALNVLQRQLRRQKQASLGSSTLAVHDELFVWFAAAALLLLVAEACISTGKNRLLNRITFFRKGHLLKK